MLRDLRHADGGFFSAEDADSEGVEGKFYVWSLEELEELCGDALPDVVRHFGVTARGNFEDPHTGFRGNILHAVGRPRTARSRSPRCCPRCSPRASTACAPGSTTRCCSGGTRCSCGRWSRPRTRCERDDWMDAARTNARFLLDELRRDDGRLLRSWQDGRANLLAYAEDYGALLGALLTLAELDDVQWLAEARAVADDLVALFADDERGGFFTTGDDAEALIVRPKDFQDNATPSENSLAADGLLRLAALTGDPDGARRAERWLATLAPVLGEHPTAFAYLLEALERAVQPSLELAIVGDDGPERDALVDVVRTRVLPGSVRVTAPPVWAPSSPRCSPIARSSTVGPRPTCASTSRVSCRSRDPDALRAQLDGRLDAER